MKKSLMSIGFAALFLTAGIAGAADVGVTVDGGTTGAGVHFSTPLMQTLNARVGVNYYNYSYSSATNNVNYDFKLKLSTFDALLDWFPFNHAFRMTGGLVYNGNKITATGKPSNGTYTLNGNTYQASTAGNLDGTISFRKVAPYLGIGFGNPVAAGKGWGFSSDFGVMFQGSASTTLVNSGCTAVATTCAQLASDASAENAQLANKVSNFKAYPVIRVGVSYHF